MVIFYKCYDLKHYSSCLNFNLNTITFLTKNENYTGEIQTPRMIEKYLEAEYPFLPTFMFYSESCSVVSDSL